MTTVDGLHAAVTVGRGSFELTMDLVIPPGTTVAVLGPNGAGKSTLAAVLAGVLPIESGRVALGERVLDDPAAGVFVPPEQRNVGVVFQDYLLFPHLSVLENAAFGLRSRGLARDDARARAQAWLGRLGLDDVVDRRPGELSGGQAQRVALARALATEPDLLVLDEPLAALDVRTRSHLRRELAEHLDRFEGPRLLITHDPTEAALLADQVVVIEDGAVTQAGTAEEIRLRPRTRYAADLAGSNLFVGEAADGVVDLGGHQLQVADRHVTGHVVATVLPSAVAVHLAPPSGSPRNAWATSVRFVESLGDVVRLLTGGPLPITAEVTRASARDLGLEPGTPIWVSIKATEVRVEVDEPG